jgi:hypothetical protein
MEPLGGWPSGGKLGHGQCALVKRIMRARAHFSTFAAQPPMR